MRILVIGSGGREHAIGWKLSQSENCDHLFFAPGNGGTTALGENINISVNDVPALKRFCLEKEIDLVVIGPEAPLVDGLVDELRKDEKTKHILVFGPDAKGAMLEGSKEFAKSFMQEFDIPTAGYRIFDAANLQDGIAYLDTVEGPYVLKADGLAGGKGVLILEDRKEAKVALGEMIAESKFGQAGSRVVIEEFLSGREFSVFVLTDGQSYRILPIARDYKRVGEGDTGLNTGGMGAVSPVPFVDADLMRKVEELIVKPSVKGLQARGMDYRGILYCGLIEVNEEPFVIEYNCRFGDPETEVVLPRLKSDLVTLMSATADKRLSEQQVSEAEEACCTVVVCSGGYPESYEKGKQIEGLEQVTESIVFHAGTKKEGANILTNGGRVLAISSMGADLKEALAKSYRSIDKICFEKIYFRKDIGS